MRDKTTAQILDTFDVNRQTLQSWIGKGMPYEPGKGRSKPNKFDEAEIALWLRDKGLTGKIGRPTGPMSEEMAAAKLRHLIAQADIAEMERDGIRGTLVKKDEQERLNVKKFTVIRNKLLGLPAAVAPSIAGLEAAEIEHEIEQRITEILTELSRE